MASGKSNAFESERRIGIWSKRYELDRILFRPLDGNGTAGSAITSLAAPPMWALNPHYGALKYA